MRELHIENQKHRNPEMTDKQSDYIKTNMLITTGLAKSRLLDFRGPIYKMSYDNLTIMPKLRLTYDGRQIYKTSYKE